jgi:hypothetical protein
VPKGLKALVDNVVSGGKPTMGALTIEVTQVHINPTPVDTPQSALAATATPTEIPSQNEQAETVPGMSGQPAAKGACWLNVEYQGLSRSHALRGNA